MMSLKSVEVVTPSTARTHQQRERGLAAAAQNFIAQIVGCPFQEVLLASCTNRDYKTCHVNNAMQ